MSFVLDVVPVTLPRLHLEPAAMDDLRLAAEAVDLARQAGLDLDPWQELVLRCGMARRADGLWSAFEVGEIVPRQNGKGAVLEARELAGLFLADEELILHSAHEFKTAAEGFRRIDQLIDGCSWLSRLVKRVWRSHGDEGIELRTGARLRFVARSRGSGRGFSADCVILDEAYHLSSEAMAALLPTLSARPNPQLWLASSAPLTDSPVLHSARRRAKAQLESGERNRLALLEWSAAETFAEVADRLDDPELVARGNPALGRRLTLEQIAAERGAMGGSPETYARERLGVPDPDPEGETPPIDMAQWDGLASADKSKAASAVWVVDVDVAQSSASIGMAGLRDGKVVVELVANRPGSAWVDSEVERLRGEHGGRWLRLADGPVASVAGDWWELVSGADLGRACAAFEAALLAGSFAHLGQPEVRGAINGAAKVESENGSWRWGRKSSTAAISPLVAFTLAVWAMQAPERPNPAGQVW